MKRDNDRTLYDEMNQSVNATKDQSIIVASKDRLGDGGIEGRPRVFLVNGRINE